MKRKSKARVKIVPPKLHRDTTAKVLCLDPGSVNFGWSVIKIKNRKWSIVKCGMIRNTIKDLKGEEYEKSIDAFAVEFSWMLTKARPTHVFAERYTSRIRGTTIEAVNGMLGTASILTRAYNRKTMLRLVMAANWKFRIKKIMDLESYYKTVGVPDHVVDSCFLGLYNCELFLGLNIDQFKFKTNQARLRKELERKFIKVEK